MRTLVLPCLLASFAFACGAPRGRVVTPADLPELDRAADLAVAPALPPGAAVTDGLTDALAKERHDLDRKALSIARRREDLARDAAELGNRATRTQIEHESALASEAVERARAQRELRIAQDDLVHFDEVELARRQAETELELRGSADGLRETREELAQLEMMYGDAALGDATAEIVLERTRRRLQRAEEGHRLREARAAERRTIEWPRERERLALELQSKQVALENAERAAAKAALQRAAALAELEDARIGHERERADIELDARLLADDEARWERKVASGEGR